MRLHGRRPTGNPIKRIALFLALALAATCAPALAAVPTVVQVSPILSCAGGGPTATLPAAPTNGNVVVVWGVQFGVAVPHMTDSNSVALTLRTQYNTGHVAIFDYVVSGSPTGVYTGVGSTPIFCAAELSAVNATGTFASNSSFATIAAVNAGDIVICTGITAAANVWTTTSPASPSQIFPNTYPYGLLYGISTATGSNSCTGGGDVAFAAYTTSGVGVPFLGSSYLFH